MKDNLQLLQFQLNQKLALNSEKRRKLATTGRIEPSRLAHYKTSKLLFSQPIPNSGKEYKATFLLDVSISMGGNRIETAVKSLQKLIKLFTGVIDFNIVLFWYGMQQVSPAEILSIREEDISVRHPLLWGRRMDTINIGGKKTLMSIENGAYSLNYSTAWQWAFQQAVENLKKETGEKMIIFLTDWDDGDYYNHRDYNSGELLIERIWDVDVEEHNKGTYRDDIKEALESGINVIPFSIWDDILSRYFDNNITLSSAEDVYKHTLGAIDKFYNNNND